MHQANLKLLLLLPFMIAGTAFAGTVTLTGSCIQENAAYGKISFILVNSGNQSASSLSVVPSLIGSGKFYPVYTYNELMPGTQINLSINSQDINGSGVYPAYFNVSYRQGTALYSDVFPCTSGVEIGNATVSSWIMLTYGISNASSGYMIGVNALNAGYGTANATIGLVAPGGLDFSGQSTYDIEMRPGRTYSVNFTLGNMAGGYSSYTAMLYATYRYGGLVHSTISDIVIKEHHAKSQVLGDLVIFMGIFAFLIVVALLARIALIRSMRKRAK